ncbi:hypothetical protein V6Z05_00345 [Leptospira venezuelensis]|uniref:hypothetical protein n=1 Tax=Leptospira venezuelensis TaxID=1958811 RepID=UPI000A3913A6|nr:hypothetical protein [Leptospira venezuelensis]
MKSFKKFWIIPFFTFWFCNRDPYIKQIPVIIPGKEVVLEIALDNSLMPKYEEMILTKFCLGRSEQNLEENCEVDPVVRYYTIKPNEPMRLILPEGSYPYGKMIFWAKGPSHDRSSMAVAYFSNEYNKTLGKENCKLKGVSLEGSITPIRYNCKGFVFRSREVHRIVFRVLDDSYIDGLAVITALTPFPVGGDYQAAEVKYSVSPSKN